jgi:hypothetical protein
MKPELQCIAIAEACGWTVINDSLCHITPDRNGEPQIAVIARLPDYLNDLNAMAEAENLVLKSAQQCRDYANVLDDGNGGHFATSAQRAEAFLRTIGKWEES